MKEKGDEIIGKKVKIKHCEAAEHGNKDCICDMIGQVVRIRRKYKTP